MAGKSVKNEKRKKLRIPKEAPKRFSFGGGLLIEGEDAHLTDITLSGLAPLSFGSLVFDFGDVSNACRTEIDEKYARSGTRLYLPLDPEKLLHEEDLWDAYVQNTACSEPAFLRTIRTCEPLCLRFILPAYCSAVCYARYPLKKRFVKAILLRAKAGAPCKNGTFTDREHRLIVLMSGNITCNSFGMSLTAQPGVSGIAILGMDDKTDEELAESAYLAVSGGMLAPLTVAPNDPDAVDGRLLDEDGAPVFSLADRRTSVDALIPFVTLEKRAKKDEKAYAALWALAEKITREKAVFGAYPHIGEAPDPAAGAAFLNACAIFADFKTALDPKIRALLPALKIALYQANDSLAGGMLPPIAENAFSRAGLLPEDTRFFGSSEASADYIDGASWLLRCLEKNDLHLPRDSGRTASLLREAVGRFRENFLKDGEPTLLSCARENYVRRPPEIFGVCDLCSKEKREKKRERLIRARGGCYLCPECLSLFQNEKRRSPDGPFFGAYALARIARSEILRKEIGDEYLSQRLSCFLKASAETRVRVGAEDAYLYESAVLFDVKSAELRLSENFAKTTDPLGTHPVLCVGKKGTGEICDARATFSVAAAKLFQK